MVDSFLTKFLLAAGSAVTKEALTATFAQASYNGALNFIESYGSNNPSFGLFLQSFGQPIPGTFAGIVGDLLCNVSLHNGGSTTSAKI